MPKLRLRKMVICASPVIALGSYLILARQTLKLLSELVEKHESDE